MNQARRRRQKPFPGRGEGAREPDLESLRDEALDGLMTHKLIEQEALRRHYERAPDFKARLEKRREVLLVDAFKVKIVYPLAVPSKEELQSYYRNHRNRFKRGYEVRFGEMAFRDLKRAEQVSREIAAGARFEFLASRISGYSSADKGPTWVPLEGLSESLRNALAPLKVGEVSDVVVDGGTYRIIKLKGKRGGEAMDFAEALDSVRIQAGREKFARVLAEYLNRLRMEARIKVYKRTIRRLEKHYLKDSKRDPSIRCLAG
jgi:parvulin-like peptidyl-prolyl isomerase